MGAIAARCASGLMVGEPDDPCAVMFSGDTTAGGDRGRRVTVTGEGARCGM